MYTLCVMHNYSSCCCFAIIETHFICLQEASLLKGNGEELPGSAINSMPLEFLLPPNQ